MNHFHSFTSFSNRIKSRPFILKMYLSLMILHHLLVNGTKKDWEPLVKCIITVTTGNLKLLRFSLAVTRH